jgi:hypothetical protein
MSANDLALIDFLSAHPTFTFDEAVNRLAQPATGATAAAARADPERPADASPFSTHPTESTPWHAPAGRGS